MSRIVILAIVLTFLVTCGVSAEPLDLGEFIGPTQAYWEELGPFEVTSATQAAFESQGPFEATSLTRQFFESQGPFEVTSATKEYWELL